MCFYVDFTAVPRKLTKGALLHDDLSHSFRNMSHVEQCRTKKFTDRLELQGVGIGKDTLARPAVWGARDFSREKMMRSVRAHWLMVC